VGDILELGHLVIRKIEDPEPGIGLKAAEVGYSVMRNIELF